MDREKYTNKTNEILTWLDVNDAGAMDSVIRTNIQAGMDSEDENLDRFWAAVRAVCGTLPVSPIRHGQPSSLAPEIQASVDNVVNRVTDAFVSQSRSGILECGFQSPFDFLTKISSKNAHVRICSASFTMRQNDF